MDETFDEELGPAGGEPEYRPGDQIAGRYQVISTLGRGGSGVVYRALDLSTDEQVAVKLVFDPVGGVAQLRREVRAAWSVTHPSVVRVFDIVEHRDGVLLSMQYAAGGTLADRLGSPMDSGAVLEILDPLLAGLGAAHAAGLVHRDLKPHNVLFTEDGRLLLSDFGIAHALAEDATGMVVGTPAYMAPEQRSGGAIDERTDLYAVGVLAWELATGERPAAASTVAFTLDDAVGGAAALARSGSPLDEAILRLTDPDPDRRPADVAEARRLLGLDRPEGLSRWSLVLVAAIAAVIAAGAVWTLGPGPTLEPVARALTAGDEMISDPPVFLPDGRIVFASDRLGSRQLWQVDPGREGARPLTEGRIPKWAPQRVGAWLYLQLARPDGTRDLVRVPAETGEVSEAELTPWMHDVRRPRVTEDGRVLTIRKANGTQHMVLRQVDEAEPVGPLDRDILYGDWSPSGDRIAFMQRDQLKDEVGSLWVLDLATEAVRSVAEGLPAWSGIAWLDPDELVVFRGTGDGRTLVGIRADGAGERPLARRLTDGVLPAIGPDGQLAYLTDGTRYAVWVYREGAGLQQVTGFGGAHAKSPSWVPATDELVYLVEQPGRGFEVRRVDGATFSKVSARRAIGGDNPYVAFSPDGTSVAYSEQRDDASQLLLADIHSDSPPRVLASAGPETSFTPIEFALGGARVTYTTTHPGGGGGRDVAVEGGPERVLIDGYGPAIRSADGQWITWYDEQDTIGVWQMGPDGPLPDPIRIPGTEASEIARYGPGPTELTWADVEALYTVDFLTGERRQLAELPRRTWFSDRLSIHPDGRVAMMLAVGERKLVLVENFDELAD